MRSVLELLSEMNSVLALILESRMQDRHKAMLKTEMQKLFLLFFQQTGLADSCHGM